MRALFISHEASRSGAPIALLRELLYLKSTQEDLECEVLMLRGGELLADFSKNVTTLIGWLEPTLWVRILRKLGFKRVLKPYLYKCDKRKYDFIYANTVASFPIAVELKNRYKIPLIGHVHEAENLMFRFEMSKEVFCSFDKLIAVSELTKRNLMDIYEVPSERIELQHPVSYWISEAMDNNIAIKKADLLTNDTIIGLFSDGGWYKSTELIPVAVSNFFHHFSDSNCKFAIVGKIDEIVLYRLKYDLRKAGVLDKVLFLGAVEDPLDYHARFDVFLLLSREESFSLVATEAAIMETPIVGFDEVTGAVEWMRNGAGLLVPYMDFDGLSKAIYTLCHDTEQRRSIAKEAKKRVIDMYKEESSMAIIISAIKEVSCNTH